MSTSHTQSLTVRVASQSNAPAAFKTLAPVVTKVDSLLDQGLFAVKGSFQVNGKAADMDNRWATLTVAEVADMVASAEKHKSITSGRVVSAIAGSGRNIAGSEACVILNLAHDAKLCKSLGIDYTMEIATGRNQEYITEVGHQIIVTLEALAVVKGFDYPGIEKTTPRVSRMDNTNPTLQDAVSYFTSTGVLPERTAQPRTPRGVNTNIAELFNVDSAAITAQAQAGRERAAARRELYSAQNTV